MLFQQVAQKIFEKIHLEHHKHHKMKIHLKKEKFLINITQNMSHIIRKTYENCHIEHSLPDNVLFL